MSKEELERECNNGEICRDIAERSSNRSDASYFSTTINLEFSVIFYFSIDEVKGISLKYAHHQYHD
jgi:hypothetical protein